MAYAYTNSKGDKYYLHSRKSGKGGKGTIFFFSKEEKDNAVNELPEGYQVQEIEKTGLPVLKKNK